MTGAARKAAARRAAAPSPAVEPEDDKNSFQNWQEHRIDSVIYENDEEVENAEANDEGISIIVPDRLNKSGATTPGSPPPLHESVTRQRSLKNVYKTKDEERVIVVCHDESSNEIPCNEVAPSRDSHLQTPSSVLDPSTPTKTETGSLLIAVSDKLNSMPKHPVVLTNSLSTSELIMTDPIKKKSFRRNSHRFGSFDNKFSDSDDDSLPISAEKAREKRRKYQRHNRSHQKSLDEGVGDGQFSLPSKDQTLSVPDLHALTGSTPTRFRISHTPRLTPKPSPRLSPRLVHTVHNVKRKISEVVKHEMSSFMVSPDAGELVQALRSL